LRHGAVGGFLVELSHKANIRRGYDIGANSAAQPANRNEQQSRHLTWPKPGSVVLRGSRPSRSTAKERLLAASDDIADVGGVFHLQRDFMAGTRT
jgi:hypothetical protein